MEMRRIAWENLSEDTKKTVLGDWQTAKVTEARGEGIPMLQSKERPEWIRRILFHTNQDELLGPIGIYINPFTKEIVGFTSFI